MDDLEIIIDDKDVRLSLDRLDGAVSPVSLEAFLREEAVLWLQDRAEERFGAEGDDASGSWEPLSWATERIRASLGYGAAHPINKRTGILENWVIHNDGQYNRTAGGARLIWPGPVTDDELDKKFRTAQKGRSNPPTGARPVVAANEFDMEMIMNGVAHWVADLAGLEI